MCSPCISKCFFMFPKIDWHVNCSIIFQEVFVQFQMSSDVFWVPQKNNGVPEPECAHTHSKTDSQTDTLWDTLAREISFKSHAPSLQNERFIQDILALRTGGTSKMISGNVLCNFCQAPFFTCSQVLSLNVAEPSTKRWRFLASSVDAPKARVPLMDARSCSCLGGKL